MELRLPWKTVSALLSVLIKNVFVHSCRSIKSSCLATLPTRTGCSFEFFELVEDSFSSDWYARSAWYDITSNYYLLLFIYYFSRDRLKNDRWRNLNDNYYMQMYIVCVHVTIRKEKLLVVMMSFYNQVLFWYFNPSHHNSKVIEPFNNKDKHNSHEYSIINIETLPW